MADFQEDGDRKLQIFAYLHVGVTTLSSTIGLYLWYCFIYRDENFVCQWHFKPPVEATRSAEVLDAVECHEEANVLRG